MSDIHFSLMQRTLKATRAISRSVGNISERESMLICASDGQYQGYGEACPLPSFAGESYNDCYSALKSLPSLSEHSIKDIVSADINKIIPAQRPCAQFALQGSLLDLIAQRQQQTIAQLINPMASHCVKIQALLEIEDDKQTSTCPIKKYKIGQLDLEEDIKRIKNLCTSLQPHEQIRLDANGAWSLDQARTCMQQLIGLPIAYLEDPCSNLDDIAICIQQNTLPIAIDQALHQPATQEQALSLSPHAWVIKPMCLGSINNIRHIIDTIKQKQSPFTLSDFHNGNIARCYSRHLAAAFDPENNFYHGLGGHLLFENDYGRMAPLQPDSLYTPLENPHSIYTHVADHSH